jgi:hypothetical protein
MTTWLEGGMVGVPSGLKSAGETTRMATAGETVYRRDGGGTCRPD